jgi:hypothetical protein
MAIGQTSAFAFEATTTQSVPSKKSGGPKRGPQGGGASLPATKGVSKAAKTAAAKQLSSGIALAKKGKHKAAVERIDSAMRGGALSPAQMAQALYYRGTSHSNLGNALKAQQDLARAKWLNSRLDPRRRSASISQSDINKTVRAAKVRASARVEPSGTAGSERTGGSGPGATGWTTTEVRTAQNVSQTRKTSSGFGNLFGSLFGGGSQGLATGATKKQQPKRQVPTQSWGASTTVHPN